MPRTPTLLHAAAAALLALIPLTSGCACQVPARAETHKPAIHWQAHRGGGAHERPDNTMVALRYTWALGGIPEVDVRTTSDGAIICLHDKTLARTTDAPEPVRSTPANKLTLKEIQRHDAGTTFDPTYKGERVPTLDEVFTAMEEDPTRLAYLDLKDVDLTQLRDLIDNHNLAAQALVCSPKQQQCAALRESLPGVRAMLWIGGSGDDIERKYEAAHATGFAGLDQVQLHLNEREDDTGSGWRYQLPRGVVARAVRQTAQQEIDLEVFPFRFDEKDIHTLLDMGVRWFATDEPKRFQQAIANWKPGRTRN